MSRITGVNRGTVGGLALRMGHGCAELHDRMMVGLRVNRCELDEALRSTPAMALGIADQVWTIGDLLDAALATQPITPETTAPDRRKRFRIIEWDKS